LAADRLVIDASVAIKASLVERGFDALTGWELHAPSLIWSEGAAGIGQLRWRSELTPEEADASLARLLAAPIREHRSAELVQAAAVLAASLGWAKTYDAEYVALAARLECPLVTLDARLARGAADIVDVRAPADL
jgi:predicted nucleic acid-binding protein